MNSVRYSRTNKPKIDSQFLIGDPEIRVKMIFFVLLLQAFLSLAQAGEPSVRLKEHKVPAENCEDCHMKKNRPFMPSKKEPERNHPGKSLQHGKEEIACGSCHDIRQSNRLRTSKEAPATFAQPSPVCMRCHVEEFRNWSEGIHGKRTGGWNREKLQSQCVDCHNPHSVPFKKMQANPAPKKPKFHVDKASE